MYFLAADEDACILAESKTEGELESYHKFRLFGAGCEYTLEAEGEDYRVTLNLSALEGLLDNVEFTADEITGETVEIYSEKAQEALGFEEVGFQRFFRLGFSKTIPKELVRISSVVIQYKDNAEGFDINGAGGVVSFKGDSALVSGDTGTAVLADAVQEEVLTPVIDGRENTIAAEISELANIGTVWMASTGDLYYQKAIDSIEDLDGKDFLISNVLTNGTSLVMGTAAKTVQGKQGLTGYSFAGGPVVNRSADMGLWHFEKQSNDTFYISRSDITADDRYLNIADVNADKADVTIGPAQELTVNCNNGKIEILIPVSEPTTRPHMYVNSYGGGGAGGFAGWHADNNTGSLLTLYEKQDIDLDLAFTIENVYAGGRPVSEYITEETEPELLDEDTFEMSGTNLYVDFTDEDSRPSVSEAIGEEKKYEFDHAQIICTAANNAVRNIDHIYVSNDAQYKLIFYNGRQYVGTYEPDQVRIQNVYRAYKKEPLEIEPTISTKGKIHIRMIDYAGRQFSGWGWTQNNKEVKQGILNPYLDANEYPSFAHEAGYDTGQGENEEMREFNSTLYGTDTLEDYFAAATEADKLFLEDTFVNGEYYEYRSIRNGAAYNAETGDFTVYKQLTTTTDGSGALVSKGQFLPYNTFDTNRKIANVKNKYNAQGQALSPEDADYGKDLYLPDESAPNYEFGMEIQTKFYQMKDGKVGANSMIYEFSGDDDLWVYIDGVLILDMGGCHDARAGHIDFSTGEVVVQGKTATTLYQLFENAHEAAVADGADQSIIDDLSEKLDDSKWKDVNGNKIFADYSKHDFKMWYMERGQGASNLEVRFNLPVIPPGDVQVEKRLSNTEQGAYTNQKFDFQVYLQPLIDNWNSSDDEDYKDVPESEYRLLNEDLYKEGRTEVKAYVVQPDGRRAGVALPADGIFQLYPGERLVLEGLKRNRKYFVRELNMNYDEYSGIDLDQIVLENGIEKPVTDRVDLTPDITFADTDTRVVGERVYILINNECSEKNRNALLIKKEMSAGSGDSKGDTYDIRVWLGGPNGALKPYEGKYYLNIEPDAITGTTPEFTTKAGEPGIISEIAPNDTIVIKDLLTGTKFLVEEVDPGEQYDAPVYQLEDGTYEPVNGDSAPAVTPAGPIGRAADEVPGEAMGAIKAGTDAKVTIQNTRYDETTWHIIKQSSTTGGPFVEAVFELAASDGRGDTYYGKSSVEDGKVTWYSDRDCTQAHQIQIKDLAEGSYTLTEIEVSPGYILSKETWEIEVKKRSEVEIAGQTPEIKKLQGNTGAGEIDDYVYTFYNEPMYELPHAGGRGIYWYLIGGMLFMIAGVLILYRNKYGEEIGS